MEQSIWNPYCFMDSMDSMEWYINYDKMETLTMNSI